MVTVKIDLIHISCIYSFESCEQLPCGSPDSSGERKEAKYLHLKTNILPQFRQNVTFGDIGGDD